MAADINRNLELMVDVHHNLKDVNAALTQTGSTMSIIAKDVSGRIQDWGMSMSDIMSMDIASNMRVVADLVKEITPLLTVVLGKMAEESKIKDVAEEYNKIKEKRLEALEKEKKLQEDLEDISKKTQRSDENPEFGMKAQLDHQKEINEGLEEGAKRQGFLGRSVEKITGGVNRLFRVRRDDEAISEKAAGTLQAALMNIDKSYVSIAERIRRATKAGREHEEGVTAFSLAIRGIRISAKIAGVGLKLFGRTAKGAFKAAGLMAKVMWTAIMGPLKLILKPISMLIGLLGGLSFMDAVKGAIELDETVNNISRTMSGAGQGMENFRKTQNKLMADIKKSAFDAGASVQDMAKIYEGLAAMHIPVEEMKVLADMSFEAAKGLGMGAEQATTLVGTLKHVGRLDEKEIKNILGSFAVLQQTIGLSAAETQSLATNIGETTRRLKAMGAGSRLIKQYTVATTSLAATFIQVGLDAAAASSKIKDLFDPESLEANIALYSQLGMSVSDATAIMQGAGEIPEDMAAKFVELSKRITAMGPIAGREYAKTMNMSYGMAQQLSSLTADQADKVNEVMGRGTASAEDALEEQRTRQKESMKEQAEMAKNRMQLLMMETVQPMLELMKEFMKALNGLFKELMPYAKQLGGMLSEIVMRLVPLIKPIMDMVLRVIDMLFKGGKESIFEKMLGVVDQVVALIFSMMPVVEEIIGALADMFFAVIGPIIDIVSKIIDALEPIITSILGFILKILPPIMDLIMVVVDALMPVIEILSEILTTVFDTFGNILTGMMETYKGPLEKIMKVVTDVIKLLVPIIQKMIKQLEPVFALIFDVVGKVVVIVAELITKLMPTFEKIFDLVADLFDMLMPIIIMALEMIMPLLDMLDPLLEIIIWVIELLVKILDPIIRALFKMLMWWMEKLIGFYTKLFEGIGKVMTKAIEVVKNIITAVKAFFDNILAKINQVLDKITRGKSKERREQRALEKSAEAFQRRYRGPVLQKKLEEEVEEEIIEGKVMAREPGAIGPAAMTVEQAKNIDDDSAQQLIGAFADFQTSIRESTAASQSAATAASEMAGDIETMKQIMQRHLPNLDKIG